MSNYPTLKNPPAVEAVLDVQGIFPKGVELHALADLADAFKQNYPKRTEERLWEFNFQHQLDGKTETNTQDCGVRGYRFISSDDKEMVQCRKDGFTFNRLKPYTEWKDVYPKAKIAWDIFRKAFPEMVINRVALRYINQILVPLNGRDIDLDRYFSVNLPGPKTCSLARVGFMGQSVFTDSKTGFGTTWILAHQPVPMPDKICVLLDIDIYALGPYLLEIPPPDLWEKMRDLKNRFFFDSFTDEGIKLFQ